MAAAGGRIVLSTNIGRRCEIRGHNNASRCLNCIFMLASTSSSSFVDILKANTDWRLNKLKAWQSSVTFQLHAWLYFAAETKIWLKSFLSRRWTRYKSISFYRQPFDFWGDRPRAKLHIYPPTIFLLHPLTLLSISITRFDPFALKMCAHSYKLQEFNGAAVHQLHLAGVDHCGTIGLEIFFFFVKKNPV